MIGQNIVDMCIYCIHNMVLINTQIYEYCISCNKEAKLPYTLISKSFTFTTFVQKKWNG